MASIISKRGLWAVVLLALVKFLSPVHTFSLVPTNYHTATNFQQSCRYSIRTQRRSKLFSWNNDAGGEDETKKTKLSMRRVGGRVARLFPLNKHNKSTGKKWWVLPVAVALAAYLFLQNLFGTTSSSSYVYYQSSVYESRIVGMDGKVETSRKESVKTNMPSLMENKERNAPLIIDRSFERELNQEVESMMRDFF